MLRIGIGICTCRYVCFSTWYLKYRLKLAALVVDNVATIDFALVAI